MDESRQYSLNIALVCPDGLSVLLFCKGIIRGLQRIPESNVFVICDAGKYQAEIQTLQVKLVGIPYPRWMSLRKDITYCAHLYRVMQQNKFDVVLNFSTKSNIYGTVAGKLAKTKSIFSHVVGLGTAFQPKPTLRSRMLSHSFLLLYRVTCQWSEKVWFTNANDRDTFLALGLVSEQKAVLSRNYLDTSEYAIESVSAQRMEEARALCELSDDERLVIMVARMIWQKGIREFTEAAQLLRESHPKLKFILVAPLETGSQNAVPESFVREKEQSANFKWLGFQDDVKRLYAIADLAVLPTYYKEGGYPRALLEPMAMGKPVITTTSEDCRGTVEEGKNGFLVPIQDSEALAEAIDRVMSDDGLREALGNYSRVKAVRDFDERAIVTRALCELGLPVPELTSNYPCSHG